MPRTTPKTPWSAALIAGAVGVVLFLSACTGEVDKAPPSPPPPTRAAQPEGAMRDLKDVRCQASQTGAWGFSARLQNSSDKESDYTVRVSVIKKEGSTVVGDREVHQRVAAGQSADLRIDEVAKPAEKADELLCVPTVTVSRA